MTDDTYNGWANRETWATALHLGNDQGLDEWALNYAQSALEEARADDFLGEGDEIDAVIARAITYTADSLETGIEEWAQDVADAAASREGSYPMSSGIVMMLDEIGSRWRVDWRAVAAGYVDTALEEAAEIDQ